MDVLCTDKAGTLTEGVVRLDGALDVQRQPYTAVLRSAYLNAHLQTGLNNSLDEAIQAYAQQAGTDISAEQKVCPGTLLLVSTLVFIGITLVLPYLPFISVFGFVPLPAPLVLAMIGLTALYVLVTELAKKYFYSRVGNAMAWVRSRQGAKRYMQRCRIASLAARLTLSIK